MAINTARVYTATAMLTHSLNAAIISGVHATGSIGAAMHHWFLRCGAPAAAFPGSLSQVRSGRAGSLAVETPQVATGLYENTHTFRTVLYTMPVHCSYSIAITHTSPTLQHIHYALCK